MIFVEEELIGDVEVTGTRNYHTNRYTAQLQIPNNSPANGSGNILSPTPSSFSEHSDPHQNSPLTESFVQLTYSSSSESISVVDCGYGNTKAEMKSIDINRKDKRFGEVIDEHGREGQ